MSRLISILIVASVALVAAILPAAASANGGKGDTARYILPPGNYGGIPFTDESTDQLPLYSGLTPLRDNITKSDIDDHFLPEDFAPIGDVRTEDTGERGLRLVYDAYGIPHVYGKTRYDVAFGAGWATARDRQLLLQLGRGPARAAIADVPNLDAFSLVTSGQSFVPSAATEALVTKQRHLIVRKYPRKGRQVIRDASAYADGINAYMEANNIDQPPATVNDVIAVTAFIGSIFGAGGGGEAANADLLANLEQELGQQQGYDAWEDAMLFDDPEAPTTLKRHFDYGPLTGGRVKGSVVVDPDSIESVDPSVPDSEAGAAPARREASNWLIAARRRSASDDALAVMGPQLGYYYPEIVEQIDLHGPGIKAQGVGVPGLAMYILIGRTEDYAWSLTSASHDVRDVFAEQLCEPDGSAPSRATDHYLYKGECRPFESFTAGELNGTPLTYDVSVHGAVYATATVDGKPYALSRERSTFGRDGLNLVALHDMTMGKASSPKRFYKTANEFGFTFNWGYTSRNKTAYFSSGRLPERARHLDRRLPTLGTGDYEWNGYLSRKEHPHGVGGPGGLLLNWNNQSAPGFMHGDDDPYGSVHRVELFDQWPKQARITDNVGIMNRAASEDVRSPVWPIVSRVLHSCRCSAPNARDQQVVDLLDDWVDRDAARLDVDENHDYDEAGPTIMDNTWRPIAEAVMEPRFGDLLDELNDVRNLGGLSGESYVDKDLRTLLGDKVRGRYNLSYCGKGSLYACRASLWDAVDASADELAAEFGSDDPASWRGEANWTGFVPGLLPIKFPATNRPTFQQVLQLQHRSR